MKGSKRSKVGKKSGSPAYRTPSRLRVAAHLTKGRKKKVH